MQRIQIKKGQIISGKCVRLVSGGNAQFLGSDVNWMNGEQTTAVINAKSMSAASLSVPTSAAIPLGVLFTLVLPIVCIIAGAVVCVVRRRR